MAERPNKRPRSTSDPEHGTLDPFAAGDGDFNTTYVPLNLSESIIPKYTPVPLAMFSPTYYLV